VLQLVVAAVGVADVGMGLGSDIVVFVLYHFEVGVLIHLQAS
jgi:hypothetical protein